MTGFGLAAYSYAAKAGQRAKPGAKQEQHLLSVAVHLLRNY
jgi:hypothetical protein